jgi:hypothetical protein
MSVPQGRRRCATGGSASDQTAENAVLGTLATLGTETAPAQPLARRTTDREPTATQNNSNDSHLVRILDEALAVTRAYDMSVDGDSNLTSTGQATNHDNSEESGGGTSSLDTPSAQPLAPQ